MNPRERVATVITKPMMREDMRDRWMERERETKARLMNIAEKMRN
jgi:hypothetical protein